MNRFTLSTLLGAATLLIWASPGQSFGQDDSGRIKDLESTVSRLENQIRQHGDEGIALFICGAFCALWAQNTGRNAWLWFFLGLFFNVITVLVLLYKNSNEKREPG